MVASALTMPRPPTMSNERSHAGLRQASEYNPSAIGQARIEAGEPDQTFRQYGLETVPLVHNGEDTGRRFIRQNGNFIADVSAEYKLLPNESVVEAANQVARDLGAEPFHHFDGDWFVQLDDHVYQDEERRRVHALYAWESGFVGNDAMEYGFSVHNSIDASQSFNVTLFSFRHACANMVHIGTGGYRDQMAQDVESEREVLHTTTHKHTKGLEVNVDSLTALVKSNLLLINNVDETYNRWRDQVVTPEQVEGLLRKRLPAKDLPSWVAAAHDDIETEKDDRREHDDQTVILPDNLRASIVEAHIPSGEMVWDTYNDLTANIWHNPDTSDTTKQQRERKVHAVLPPIQFDDR